MAGREVLSQKNTACRWATERGGIAGSQAIVSQYPVGVTTPANRKSWLREATGSR